MSQPKKATTRLLLLITVMLCCSASVYYSYYHANSNHGRTQIHLVRASGGQLTDFFAGLSPNQRLSKAVREKQPKALACRGRKTWGDRVTEMLGLGSVVYAQDNCFQSPCANCGSSAYANECVGSCGTSGEFDTSAPDSSQFGVKTLALTNCGTAGCGCELDTCEESCT
jgi:hypothetical protein